MESKNRLQSPVVRCPKCKSSANVKDGVVNEKQRFKCKECNYRYTVLHRGLDLDVRRKAIQLYLAGFGSRAIAKLLECSHVTINQWINDYAELLKPIRSSQENQIVELKDLQSYVEHKTNLKDNITLVINKQNSVISLCIPINIQEKSP